MNIKGKWNSNEYKFIKLIGRGNFGRVYKVKDNQGNIRAIKISKDTMSITNEYNAMNKFKTMFFVPKIYDFDDWEDKDKIYHFIVMDYIEGSNLKEVGVCKKLHIKTIFRIGHILINILGKINELGYKYTDIKLENIIIDRKGNLYFVDFGSLIEKDKPTKEYTPIYNINSWNVSFNFTYDMGILFSITMIMISLIGKQEFNPLVYELEQVVNKIDDYPLKRIEKQFLINGLKGQFKNFNQYRTSLSLLFNDKRDYNNLSKIDYLFIISVVSFVFVIIIGIRSTF